MIPLKPCARISSTTGDKNPGSTGSGSDGGGKDTGSDGDSTDVVI